MRHEFVGRRGRRSVYLINKVLEWSCEKVKVLGKESGEPFRLINVGYELN